MSKPSEAVLSKLSKNILDCLDVRERESEFECYQTKYLNNAEREAIERLGGVCEPSGKFFVWRVPKKKAVGSQRIVIGKVDQKRLPITLIDASPFQFRSKIDNEKILELCRSIKQVGVLEPIGVRTKEEGRFEVVFGHRRYEACKRLKFTEIPVHMLVLGDEEVIFAQLIENLQREDASDYDVGKAIFNLTKKFTQEQIGERISLKHSQINNYLAHYQFCNSTLSTTVDNGQFDFSKINERQTRPLRKIDEQSKVRKALKNLDLEPNTKITRQIVGEIRKDIALEGARQYQDTEVKDFLVNHHYLGSLLSYKERGSFGDAKFPGNASGFLLVQLIDFFKPKTLFDPMDGGKTSYHVCNAIGVTYFGNDLQDENGYDLVTKPTDELPINDLTYFHPPYWDLIKYTSRPEDLSNIKSWDEFLEKLDVCITKLLKRTKVLAILIGDIVKEGKYFTPLPSILNHNNRLKRILIKERFTVLGIRGFYDSMERGEIPLQHEYVVLLKGDLFD